MGYLCQSLRGEKCIARTSSVCVILSFDQSKRQNFDRDKTLNKTIPPLFLRLMNITSNLQITQTMASAGNHDSSRPAIPPLPSFEQIAAQVDETVGVRHSPHQNRSPACVQHSQSTPLTLLTSWKHWDIFLIRCCCIILVIVAPTFAPESNTS